MFRFSGIHLGFSPSNCFLSVSPSHPLLLYMHIYIYLFMYIYIYIYIYSTRWLLQVLLYWEILNMRFEGFRSLRFGGWGLALRGSDWAQFRV